MNRVPILFLNVLIIATCGLVYELLAGTFASYVLGDSVTQFSLVIGIYLSALGLGAWVSRFVERDLPRRFVEVELCVALGGGLSAPLLFLAWSRLSWFHVVLYGDVVLIGALVGLELPLLMRILRDQLDFKELVSRVLAFDYVGALLASLAFPLFFVPRLGLVRTSIVFGALNAVVGLWGTWLLRPIMPGSVAALRARCAVVIAILAGAFVASERITSLAEEAVFTDDVLYAETTPYQRIVVTRAKTGFQLFLNGNLQFASADEYRYHEALVHPAVAATSAPRRALVLGGGDGLALRELLRHRSIEEVVLVDLDPAMTTLHRRLPPLDELSQRSFDDPRVRVVNEDAMIWLEKESAPFDVAIVDFPDPSSFALGKLYTRRFYRLLAPHLAPDAAVSVQCTSPLAARKSYWCVIRTMESAGFAVAPYHVAVPSFGVWGFALAKKAPFQPPIHAPPGLRFLDDGALSALFVFPADLAAVPVEINRLDNQVLVRYYDQEWRRWN